MKEKKNSKDNFVKTTVTLSAAVMVILIITTVVLVNTWPQRTLDKIVRKIDNAKYSSAEVLIEEYEKRLEDVDLSKYKIECNYNLAIESILENNTENARYRLKLLDDYKDTKNLLKECDYIDALFMIKVENYEEALAMLSVLSEYKDADQKSLLCRYSIAQRIYDEGEIAKSLELFLELKEYSDAKKKADAIALEVTGASNIIEAYKILDGMNVEEMQKVAYLTDVRDELPTNVLAVGAHHTVGLLRDRTVIAVGDNKYNQCDISKWDNIIAIDAGYNHTVGLKQGGKVVAIGNNEYGQCEVDEWRNVKMIAASAYCTYGLLQDGTIVSTGYNTSSTLSEANNVKKIGAGSYAAACINKDGTVLTSHQSLYINDIGAVDVDVSTGYILTLMPNGTVSTSIEEVEQWEDIIAISAGSTTILGIKSDGSIEANFFRHQDTVELDRYTEVVAIAAGGAHGALLLADGTVVAFGDNDYGQCEVDEWDLIEFSE